MRMRKKSLGILVVATVVALLAAGIATAGSPTIDINTASVEELASLQRVGKSYAERIVAYREANGPFNSPEEIMNVKGIGQRTFEQNKDIIVVSTPKKKK
ncbi:MAG: helix-hairpin-helix domain-containing protein [Pseudomonadota bacterium]